ncbi:ABC transporter substrate-binding protein [Microlunatus soli]|uniref:Peptide/nickel transport system substrate-binding protein n=1 Tax=Microlunatus soli TaxID=630515 RepID=A0A1H1REA4_9ACTN|nr:ABC transporter substrate-binding protein [Microlunatus soli]SDS34015.1 peptide/nickel transport system substrate-binding protein [Microlunatus soli]
MGVKRRTVLGGLAALAVGGAVTGCNSDSGVSGGSGGGSGGAKALVVDDQFDVKTIDPARQFEPTGSTLDQQIYQQALTFTGTDVKKVQPDICSYQISSDNKIVTLKIEGKHTFSDGTEVTADDIVFSYQRVQGIKGNPSFMLDGVTVEKVDDSTVKLTSEAPNPQLPYILPNASLSIVNSKVVKQNGGTTGTDDKAEQFLNEKSQGSGAYMVESYNAQSKITLKPNPHYAGDKPVYGRIVMENVTADSQKVNLLGGTAQIATGIAPDEIASLDTSKAQLIKGTSTTTIFLWFNADPKYGKAVSDVHFVNAMRHAVDYQEVLKVAGVGSVQPGGLVPVSFLGALESDEANSYDAAEAKRELAASPYNGEPITVLYSNDVGYSLDEVAQTVQAQVKKVGINLKLAPQPSATSLDRFRSGKQQAGIAYWGADYPDPADYLVFAPGQSVAVRAAWTPARGKAAAALAKKAAAITDNDDRAAAYQELQREFNRSGPWIPLYQPPAVTVAAPTLKNVVDNPATGILYRNIT